LNPIYRVKPGDGAASPRTIVNSSMLSCGFYEPAPWRGLPPAYGDWKNTRRRFSRWRDSGVWEALLNELVVEPDFEWLMIDASHYKVHPHAAGARGGNQGIGRTNGGSTPRYIWPWMRMVCRSESLLQKVPGQIVRKLTP
jgi:transposase